MKKRNILLISLISLIGLVACEGGEIIGGDDLTVPSTETEAFADEIVSSNVEKFMQGFTMEGTVTQTRYASKLNDETGFYEIDGDPLEFNTYYTNIAFDNRNINAFYKYSYRNIEGVEIPAEGPYCYFEDENGYAYTQTLNYKNEIDKDYNEGYMSNGRKYTFADSGFYNFFSILVSSDFTLNQEKSSSSATVFDLNADKVAIIANNLLYSLNSGAYSTIEEATLTARNGVFTEFTFSLAPITSTDDLGEVTLIANDVNFLLSDPAETIIEGIEPFEETDESRTLSEVFNKVNDNYTLKVTDSYSYVDGVYNTQGTEVENTDFYFTGEEIYVHSNDEHGLTDRRYDFYLAPESSDNPNLYPYTYDSEQNKFVLDADGVYFEENHINFPDAYLGYYVYEDLLPIVSGVSGTLFEYDEEEGCYVGNEDLSSTLGRLFITTKRPLYFEHFENAYQFNVYVDDNNNLTKVEALYSYTDTLNTIQYYGSTTLEYSNIGTTELPAIAQI